MEKQDSQPDEGCFGILLLSNKHKISSVYKEVVTSIHAYRSLQIKFPGSPGWMQATYHGIFFTR